MKISTLIIDDEPLARAMIEMLLKPRTEFKIIGFIITNLQKWFYNHTIVPCNLHIEYTTNR